VGVGGVGLVPPLIRRKRRHTASGGQEPQKWKGARGSSEHASDSSCLLLAERASGPWQQGGRRGRQAGREHGGGNEHGGDEDKNSLLGVYSSLRLPDRQLCHFQHRGGMPAVFGAGAGIQSNRQENPQGLRRKGTVAGRWRWRWRWWGSLAVHWPLGVTNDHAAGTSGRMLATGRPPLAGSGR